MAIGALTKLAKIVPDVLGLNVTAKNTVGMDPKHYGADPTGTVDCSVIFQKLLDTNANLYLAEGDVYRITRNVWQGSQTVYGPGTLHLVVDGSFVPDPLGGFHAEDAVWLAKGMGSKYPIQSPGPSPKILCRVRFDRYGLDTVGTNPKPDYPSRFWGTVDAVWNPIHFEAYAHDGCMNINGHDFYGFNKNLSYGGRNYVYAELANVGAGGCWIRDTSLGGRGRESASTGRVMPGAHFYTSTRDEPLAIFVTPSGGYIDGIIAESFTYEGVGNGVTVLDLSYQGGRIRGVVISDFQGRVTKLRGGQRALGTTACAATFRQGTVTIDAYEGIGGALYAGFRAGDPAPTGERPSCEDVKLIFPAAPTDSVPVYGFWGDVDLKGQCETVGTEVNITAGIRSNINGVVSDGTYRGVLSAQGVRYIRGGRFYGGMRNVSEVSEEVAIHWNPTINPVCIQNLPVDGTYVGERQARIVPRVYQLANATALNSVVESNRGAVAQYVDYFLDRTGLTDPGAALVTPVCVQNTSVHKDGTYLGRRRGAVSNPYFDKGISFPVLTGGYADIPHLVTAGVPNVFDAKTVPGNDTAVLTYAVEIVNVLQDRIRIRVYDKLSNAASQVQSPRVVWWVRFEP
jgi:hypothetical protein